MPIKKRRARIELAIPAWRAGGLPLHYRRIRRAFKAPSRNRTRISSLRRRRLADRRSVLVSFCQSGIGGTRTHIARFKRPTHCLVCHNPVFVLFQSGTSGSNRNPPAPKAGVLPSAPLPELLSGPGGARTLVCGSSDRRYTVSATGPQMRPINHENATKKPGVAATPGWQCI